MKKSTKEMIRRIFALFMVLTLVIAVFPGTADASSSKDLKKKLSSLESQEESVRSKISSLQKKQANAFEQKEYYDKQISILNDEISVYEDIIADYQNQIDDVDGQIDDLNDKINAMETEITVKKHEREELYKNFKTRIRVMYEEDVTSYAGIVFLADSIGDLLERLEAVMNILRADRMTMKKLEDLQDEITADEEVLAEEKSQLEEEVAELESLQAEQKAEKKALDKKKNTMEDKQYEANKLLKSIKSSIESNKDLLNDIESAEKNLEDDIRAAAKKEAEEEAARKAAEEKKRKAEEEKKKKNSGSGSSSGSGSGSSGGSSRSSKGSLAWPLPGNTRISCYYGYRTHPVTGKKNSFHTGIDIPASAGTSIKCCAAGTVTKKCYNSAYGNMIVVSHGGGLSTMYCHLRSSALYSVGDKVSQGTVLGYVGSTGLSTGNHLHLSVLENGDYVNPLKYFN